MGLKNEWRIARRVVGVPWTASVVARFNIQDYVQRATTTDGLPPGARLVDVALFNPRQLVLSASDHAYGGHMAEIVFIYEHDSFAWVEPDNDIPMRSVIFSFANDGNVVRGDMIRAF